MADLTVQVNIGDSGCSAWLYPPWGAEYAQLRRTGAPSTERVLLQALLDTLARSYDPRSGRFDLTGCDVHGVVDKLRTFGATVRIRGLLDGGGAPTD